MREEAANHILVVDDNPGTARLLVRILAGEGHRVTVACDGAEALERVAQEPPDLIFLDLRLPVLDGYEVCKRIKNDPTTRWIPIIMITGAASPDVRLHTWELGADELLAKPFQCAEVVTRCRSLLRVKRLVDELDSAEEVMFAFARAVEAKSPYTHGHSERVRTYALQLAAHIGIPSEDWEILHKGALLHDIGKISVPDAILNKRGSLTSAEFKVVQQHPVTGAHIIEPLKSVRKVLPLIRWHHERMDGRGYPDGLQAGSLPLMVRILSVADVFDSLSSPRPYREAIDHEGCLEILKQEAAAGGLDPELVRIFCDIMSRGKLPPYDKSAEIDYRLPPIVEEKDGTEDTVEELSLDSVTA